MKNYEIPDTEYMYPGHLACPGCGASLGMRFALKALEEKTIIVLPACCWSIIAGPFPYSAVQVALFHTAFETAASVASGVRAALDMRGEEETTVMAWAGDGGTFDIGLQALSGAAERNENFIYVCYDNEAYMNTGIQRSSATPEGAWTTTTPAGSAKERPKKDIVGILAAHHIPYIATATVAYPDDFLRKLRKARSIKGTRFIHLLAPCPSGWKTASEESIELARLAVNSKVFPLFEIENGEKYTINRQPTGLSVKEYYSRQGRFRFLDASHYETIQQDIDRRWAKLEKLASPNIENSTASKSDMT